MGDPTGKETANPSFAFFCFFSFAKEKKGGIMFLFEIFKALLFGLVEGITEWLPISSTGHMILLNELISLNVSDGFYEMFEVVIQLAAVLAVPICFFERISPFSKIRQKRKTALRLWLLVAVAVLPSALIGLIFDDLLDKYFYNPQTVAAMLILYGIAFIAVEKIRKKADTVLDTDDISPIHALFIGGFQVLALIPGTSRSGATILGARLLGFSPALASEFSFFLAMPTMLGAGLLKVFKFIAEGETCKTREVILLLVGALVAFLVSAVTIKTLCTFVRKHGFLPFGVYRIILGIAVISYFLLKG